MNKNLKYGLITVGVIGVGLTTWYFWPKDNEKVEQQTTFYQQQPCDSISPTQKDTVLVELNVAGDYLESGATKIVNNTTRKERVVTPQDFNQSRNYTPQNNSKKAITSSTSIDDVANDSLKNMQSNFVPLDFSGADKNLDLYSPVEQCDTLKVRQYE